ncbi:tyrosine-protein phosphatase non-receptor type 18 isoform X1 [Hemicordylus capensis]|uniref:tyrosine-protein phosphatase non-receptor type 18 isoform X1 n=1 Tax=Hemicordylus capensis TaxID=884348 RepID=UPI002302B2BC|nr:tyrosine-protein phosphatase non-receptor type 18 isoform X1 [Hemicordylus capensis]
MSRCTENLKGFLAQVEAKAGQEKGQLVEEFQEIKARAAAFRQQQGISTAAGGNKENIKKNRYKDILPYDQTRVVLNALTEEGQADYINANFIQGVDNKRCYIATQGPLAHTVLDFWHMVWQYRVKVIVMACREVEMGKKKCERYWPLAEETLQFGPFSIAQAKEQELNPDVILRKLTLTFQKEERVVSHFQYIAWPDRGIPDTYGYFLAMIEQVRHKQGEDTVPVCIHCSAGCGRTGVICTLDYIRQLLLKQVGRESCFHLLFKRKGRELTQHRKYLRSQGRGHRGKKGQRIPPHFSIFDVVLEMRKQRPAAVQTQNRLPLYDDALSLRHPAVPQLKRSTILRSISVPADPTPAALPELPPKLLRDMGDTYAVVNKARRGGAGASSANGTKPDGEAPLYAAVKPRASNVPDISAIDPNAFAGLQASHSLPGSPVRRPPPGLACEYTQIAPSVPADVSSRGTTSPSHTNGLGKTLLRNLMSPVFTSSPGKKAPPSSRTVPTQAYEDVGDAIPRGGPNAAGASTNAMGFNVRIGKPKGPRDPPAEWSRV